MRSTQNELSFLMMFWLTGDTVLENLLRMWDTQVQARMQTRKMETHNMFVMLHSDIRSK